MADAKDMIETTPDDESMAVQSYNPMAGYTTETNFEAGEAYIPRLRLAQGLTAEVQDGSAKPGDWLLVGHVPTPEMIIVPLAFARKRELRDDASRDILCYSIDGAEGIGDPGGACESCPLSKWHQNPDDPDGKNIPPACDMYYSYIVYSVTHDSVCTLELRKSALKPGRILNTMAKQAGFGNFAVKLASRKNQGTRGTYATPEFKALPGEEIEQFLDVAAQAFENI